MAITLGPIVGVSHDQVRIRFKYGKKHTLNLRLEADGVEPLQADFTPDADQWVTARFDNLQPHTRYRYTITSSAGEGLSHSGKAAFTTFPGLGQAVDFRFAFFSCHRPFQEIRVLPAGVHVPKWLKIPFLTQRGTILIPSSMRMWQALESMLDSEAAPEFMLGLGDQLYLDDAWIAFSKKMRKNPDAVRDEDIRAEFAEFYRRFWDFPELKRVAERCPWLMIWDDHEITDGWGSHGDEEENPVKQKLYRHARDSYAEHQLVHNPFVDSSKGYYAFRYGEAGFVVLDLRGYRSARHKILLGDAQWQWLQNWLAGEGQACKVIFIVCSVPFVHFTSHFTQIMGNRLGYLLLKKSGAADDFIDQWNSDPFVHEAERMARLLFDHANTSDTRFVFLGGDVHVATMAVVRSHLKEHEFHPVIYQFTSSPISNNPTPLNKLVERFAPEISFGDDVPFSGRLLKVIARRNFGIVDVRKNPRTGAYGVTFELHSDAGDTTDIHRFPTL